ncbi:hypothetical protein [Chryseobacterium indologenes]|uniref:hypothetical protein n=1 Tax=Chryseobacterium indologenes TaxID=253 RepID=UPI001BCF7219|nr:hypothetical protein [Chryseobacterium indologenes]
MEEIEAKILEKVIEQHKRSGYANGLLVFGLDKELGVSNEAVHEAIKNLLSKNKIVKLNHLNGTTYTLPK